MRRTDWRDYKIIFWIIVFLITAFVGFKGWAEPRQVFVTKSFICDTIDQLKEALDTADPHASALPMVEGCGYLQRPSPALMEEVEAHESPIANVLIVKMTFPGLGEQYGYAAYVMKPPEEAL